MTIISVYTSGFYQPITDALNNGKELVVWHQFSAMGGLQEWFLLTQSNSLEFILKRGKNSSAFTVYEWIKIPIDGKVDREWFLQIESALAKELKNQMLLINSHLEINKGVSELFWVGGIEEIKEFYDMHLGQHVEVGRVPYVLTDEIVRGYYPDENGNLKTGIY